MDFKSISRNRSVRQTLVVILLRHEGDESESSRDLRSLFVADEGFLNRALPNQLPKRAHTILVKKEAISSLVHVMGKPFT